MEKVGLEDDVPIEAGIINKSIEGAQTRVEGYNFDIRKHTVQFDDVMNKQRTVIYADRRAILEGQDLRERILDMMHEELEDLIAQHLPTENDGEEWDSEAFIRAVRTMAPTISPEITAELIDSKNPDEIEDLVMEAIEAVYAEREQVIGADNMRYVERRMMLGAIDRQWVDYLTGMEYLRQEISLQTIAQKDPLTEYQRNAYGMFDQLKEQIQRDIVYQIIPVSFQYEQHLRQVVAEQQQRLQMAQRAGMTEEQAKEARTVRKSTPKIGRNDRCPCGSGKKFKDCHLGKEQELVALLQAGGPSVSAQLATNSANRGSGAQPQRSKKR
jgi:preprotein translocase subunit SecA